ncbi:aminoglycoside phosphotransferase family protein [Streptomonospora sp. S1-112]|uniref:Aminoglycoside phosphotransferase family protein n=1 Tax=Streptomonospora mangrovi TaxID=2883123 RepID=A0A9X3SN33_9ACTN|nr:hypothetical protein [Streptomonospora mangrovi]MDA0564776.1 aminoglycoside phosphotransferase family protein [Streptomonospora mangrovi]
MSEGAFWHPPAVRETRGQGYSNTVEVVPRETAHRHPDHYKVVRVQRVQDPYDLRVLDEVETLRLLDHVPFVPRVFSVEYRGWGERMLTHDYLGLVFNDPPPTPEFRANLSHYAFENMDAIARTDWSAPHLRGAYETALAHQRENIAYLCDPVPGSDHIPLPVWSDSPTLEEALTANVIRCAMFAERRFGADGLHRIGLLTAAELEARRTEFHTEPDPGGRFTRLIHGDLHTGNLTARSPQVVDPTDPPSFALGMVDWELAGFMAQSSGLRHERAVVALRWTSANSSPARVCQRMPDLRPELLRLIAQSAYIDLLRCTERVAADSTDRRLQMETAMTSVIAFRACFLGADDASHTRSMVRDMLYPDEVHGPRYSPFPPQRLKWLAPATVPESRAPLAVDVPPRVTVVTGVAGAAAKGGEPGFKAALGAPRGGTNRAGAPLRPAVVAHRGDGSQYLPRKGR